MSGRANDIPLLVAMAMNSGKKLSDAALGPSLSTGETKGVFVMRKSWDAFFMELAYKFAERSTCDRKHVGCVIANSNHHVIATGYNGSMPGLDHCDDVGHWMVKDRSGCQRTSHAEASAIAQAARYGHPLDGTTAYLTVSPCVVCAKLLIMAGIKRIVYSEPYREMYAFDILNEVGIELRHIEGFAPT